MLQVVRDAEDAIEIIQSHGPSCGRSSRQLPHVSWQRISVRGHIHIIGVNHMNEYASSRTGGIYCRGETM